MNTTIENAGHTEPRNESRPECRQAESQSAASIGALAVAELQPSQFDAFTAAPTRNYASVLIQIVD